MTTRFTTKASEAVRRAQAAHTRRSRHGCTNGEAQGQPLRGNGDGGKKHCFYVGTQTEAKAKAQAARGRAKAGAPVKDATRTLGDWLVEWQRTFLQASSRSKIKDMHATFCRVWVIPTIGGVRLDIEGHR